MQKNKLSIIAIVTVVFLTTLACRKKMDDPTPVFNSLSSQKALVQVYNGTLNSSRNFVYVNGQPANGATVAFGAAFPSSAYGFSVWSGDNTITVKDTLTATTQVAQAFVLSAKAGSSYSIFTYDTITSPKKLIIENNFNYPTGNTAMLRFVNLIYNPTPIPSVDLYSVNKNANIFSNVQVAEITPYISVPSTTSDTWQVRQNGTTTVLATVSITSSTIAPQRSYTVVYRGSNRLSSNRGVNVIANN